MPSRKPRAASSGTSAAFGASLLVIVGVLALGFYASTRVDGDPADGVEVRVVEEGGDRATPFDDLPPEQRPAPRSARGGGVDGPFAGSPGELEESQVWKTATAQAAEADEWLARAAEARDAEDHAEYQRYAKEAKRLLDAAFEATALWEEQIVERYGEGEPAVRRILRARDDWTRKLVVLRKTTSR